MCKNQYSIHVITNVQRITCSDAEAQYQSTWNERLAKIYFWLPGTLSVLNVFDGLLLGERVSRAARRIFLKAILSDDKPLEVRWPDYVSEVKTMYLVAQNFVTAWDQVNDEFKATKTLTYKHWTCWSQWCINRRSTLKTVWWCLHQVEWDQRNHPICEKMLTRVGCQAPVLGLSLALVW